MFHVFCSKRIVLKPFEVFCLKLKQLLIYGVTFQSSPDSEENGRKHANVQRTFDGLESYF